MRQLFVPVCLGLLTWGSAIGPELSYAKLPDDGEHVVVRFPPMPKAAIAVAAAPVVRAETKADEAATLASAGYADQYEIPDPIAEKVPDVLRTLKPIVKPIIPRSRAEICDTLTDAAHSNNLPAPFFIRLLYHESGFRPGAVSSAGAEGVAQFMPETAADRGLDNPFDPLQAIAASASLLRDLAQRFGNLGLAAAAYNAGAKRIRDWLSRKGTLPQETKDYVKTITGRPAENWTAAEAGSPAIKLPRHAPCQEAAGLLAWDGPDRIPLPPTRAVAQKAAPAKRDAKAKPGAAHDAAKAPARTKERDAKTAAKPKHSVHLTER